MAALTSRQIILASRPRDRVERANFGIEETQVRAPDEGEVTVRNLWLSVDPYMANRFYDRPNYIPPFRLGKALDGGAIGEVIISRDAAYAPGDLVFSHYGWREAFTAKAERLKPVSRTLPASAYLGLAGVTGMTAYVGLFRIGQLTPDDTVYVSAAAGAVGSAVCQIAKQKGCTVIGSAGGAEKRAFLQSIGVDHAIDYKATLSLPTALREAAPDGISIYFDNVGGVHLQAALGAMRDFGCVVVCGMIGSYSQTGEAGPSNLFEIVARRLRVEGFLLGDHEQAISADFERDITSWIQSGQMCSQETVVTGIEHAPDAFLRMMSGGNIGKMLVSLTSE